MGKRALAPAKLLTLQRNTIAAAVKNAQPAHSCARSLSGVLLLAWIQCVMCPFFWFRCVQADPLYATAAGSGLGRLTVTAQDTDVVWVKDFDSSIIPTTDVVAVGAEVRC